MNYGFRPIIHLSFIVEYELVGFNPHFSHFINIVLYIIICVLIFNLLSKVLNKVEPLMLLFITLLFALHPLHTEVVASLKNRDELFSALFSLSFISYLIRYNTNRRFFNLLVASIFLFIALLSKISALIYVPIGILSVYFVNGLKIKDLITYVLLSIVVFVGYKLFIAGLVSEDITRPINFYENPMVEEKFLIKLYTGFAILLYYIRLFFFTLSFNMLLWF